MSVTLASLLTFFRATTSSKKPLADFLRNSTSLAIRQRGIYPNNFITKAPIKFVYQVPTSQFVLKAPIQGITFPALTTLNLIHTSSSSTVMSDESDDIIEGIVCRDDDIKDGEMKVFELGNEGSVLLVRENGRLSALGTKCTHYGAPLVKGVFYGGQIRCPWHGACFSSETGDIEDFPGLDHIPKYEVSVVDGQVKVRASKKDLKKNVRCKKLNKKEDVDNRTFVIVGGGAAAQACVETLREKGFKGRLVLISKEKHIPYDRPKLSKSLGAKAEELALRNPEFYSNADIELWLGKEVTSVDTAGKVVICDDDSKITYDKLLIATGGRPRSLEVPGSKSPNVCVLRTPDDANRLAELGKEKKVVIVGSSFIGMEAAAYFAGKAASVTVVGRTEVPFKAVLGEAIGKEIKKLFEAKGVSFVDNSGVSEFINEGDVLKEVVLTNGQHLPADVCLAGVGVSPATDFLKKDSGISMNAAGQVIVDKCMKTNVDGVYAAGDIVQFPLSVLDDEKVNIQHWQMAHAHGHCAALNMLGETTKLISVPYFWCSVFGKSIRYAGCGVGYDDIIIDGDLEELKFIAYYAKGNRITAMASLGKDPMVSQFASLMKSGKVMTKDEAMPPTKYPCVCC